TTTIVTTTSTTSTTSTIITTTTTTSTTRPTTTTTTSSTTTTKPKKTTTTTTRTTTTTTSTTLPLCGNGRLDAGESCDPRVNGHQCCSASCLPAAVGTPCDLDHDSCTTDQCDAGGTCVFVRAEGTTCNA